MSDTLVVFSHGKETGPYGRKIKQLIAFAETAGAQAISIDYQHTQDPDERVQHLLQAELPLHKKLILVGSSMGGYVSAVASKTLKPKGLLLMAPAIGLPGYVEQNPEPCADSCAIVHGWQDDVVASQLVYDWAARHQLMLQLVNDDHSLHQSIDCVAQHLVGMINCRF